MAAKLDLTFHPLTPDRGSFIEVVPARGLALGIARTSFF
jgi:hypothetical protein